METTFFTFFFTVLKIAQVLSKFIQYLNLKRFNNLFFDFYQLGGNLLLEMLN